LGRPWQFDKRVIYDGYTNKYYFLHNGKRFTLASLTPEEAHLDQVKFNKKRLNEAVKVDSKLVDSNDAKADLKMTRELKLWNQNRKLGSICI
jgi:hypothetical protein